jgi:hypothetical protein
MNNELRLTATRLMFRIVTVPFSTVILKLVLDPVLPSLKQCIRRLTVIESAYICLKIAENVSPTLH